eukprot:1790105-Pyramimonas_sp.AAC.1
MVWWCCGVERRWMICRSACVRTKRAGRDARCGRTSRTAVFQSGKLLWVQWMGSKPALRSLWQ